MGMEKIKSFSKSLVEKATSSKVKYVTGLIPYAGDFVYFNLSPLSRKSKAVGALIMGTFRTLGLLNLDLSGFYWGPSFGEELAMACGDIIDYEFKKSYKNRCQNTNIL